MFLSTVPSEAAVQSHQTAPSHRPISSSACKITISPTQRCTIIVQRVTLFVQNSIKAPISSQQIRFKTTHYEQTHPINHPHTSDNRTLRKELAQTKHSTLPYNPSLYIRYRIEFRKQKKLYAFFLSSICINLHTFATTYRIPQPKRQTKRHLA